MSPFADPRVNARFRRELVQKVFQARSEVCSAIAISIVRIICRMGASLAKNNRPKPRR
jgi:hypothetical protein